MSLMLPHPTMAILVLVSTPQSLFDQISITLADGFQYIGGTLIELHHQPLGRSGARRDHAGDIDHALTQRRHRRLELAGTILDVQKRRPRAHATDALHRVLSGRLHPIDIDFKEYIGIKVLE